MKLTTKIVAAVLVGLILAGVTSQFTDTKYPSCDLVEKGIGVSTYGCSNDVSMTAPCANEEPNSSTMTNCIQQNYYRQKTFPFGFKQQFGDNSNEIDSKPLTENRIASFLTGFTVTLLALITIESLKRPSKSKKN